MTIKEIECTICFELPVYVGRLNCKEKHTLCNECATKIFNKLKDEKKETGECPECRDEVTSWEYDREYTNLVRTFNGDVDQHKPLEVKIISLAKKVDIVKQDTPPQLTQKHPRFDPPEKPSNPNKIDEARMKVIQEKFISFRKNTGRNNAALDKLTIEELAAGLNVSKEDLYSHLGVKLTRERAKDIAAMCEFSKSEIDKIATSKHSKAGIKLFKLLDKKNIKYGKIISCIKNFSDFNSYRIHMSDTFRGLRKVFTH